MLIVLEIVHVFPIKVSPLGVSDVHLVVQGTLLHATWRYFD